MKNISDVNRFRRIMEAWHTGSGSRVGVKRFEASTRLIQAEAPLREYKDDEAFSEVSLKSSAEGEDASERKSELEGGEPAGLSGKDSSGVGNSSAGMRTEGGGGGGGACLTVDVVGRVVLWRVIST